MKSHCRTCNKTFGGLTGFERHRVGKFTETAPDYGRRCLSVEELAELGYAEVDGVWRDRSGDNPWT